MRNGNPCACRIIKCSGILFCLEFLFACASVPSGFGTFADYPGFSDIYTQNCQADVNSEEDLRLLQVHRPRIFIAPNGQSPIDFYKDYIAHADLFHFSGPNLVVHGVTRKKLNEVHQVPGYYLVHQRDRMQRIAPTAYGRAYRQGVSFTDVDGKIQELKLIFLKYSFAFATSGLPEKLPFGANTLLSLVGMSPEDWHQLDHYTSVTIVLHQSKPIAVLLAQHNNHRSYLIGKHISLDPNGRISLDVAKRSNEFYLSSQEPEAKKHRVIRWGLYKKYLLTGEDGPFFRAFDVTYGPNAGGREVEYSLQNLSACDPFYRAKIFLGEPRPFFGMYIGRDGPPGADYYTLPRLVPLGKLLKFSYFHEGQTDDIEALEKYIDVKNSEFDIDALVAHGGKKFIKDLKDVEHKRLSQIQ